MVIGGQGDWGFSGALQHQLTRYPPTPLPHAHTKTMFCDVLCCRCRHHHTGCFPCVRAGWDLRCALLTVLLFSSVTAVWCCQEKVFGVAVVVVVISSTVRAGEGGTGTRLEVTPTVCHTVPSEYTPVFITALSDSFD